MTAWLPTLLGLLAVSTSPPPHIVLFLADDLGHACVGTNTAAPDEIKTPNIDTIFGQNGVTLTRHYTFKFCAPTRASLQSGRLPVHVNTVNAEPECHNPADVVSGYAGIPRNMTTIASLLQARGYATYMSGKWDVGMATPRHTPVGRGYNRSLGYFHHANDYYTEGLPYASIGTVNVCNNKYTDLWDTLGPSTKNGSGYEPEILSNHSQDMIALHAAHSKDLAAAHSGNADGSSAPTSPMFLFHAFHLIHTPLQVPQAWLDKFKHIANKQRHKVAAMTNYMDSVVGKIVGALKEEAMWDNTLCVFFADNGGAIYFPAGGNNFPLRGGKYSDFEGGTNTVAFVSGGVLPPSVRGKTTDALVSAADWYGTFADAAGIVGWEHDAEAAAASLPPVDSISQWPFFSGAEPLILTGANGASAGGGGGPGSAGSVGDGWNGIDGAGATVGPALKRASVHLSSQAFVNGTYKVVTGVQVMAVWQGPRYPNNTGLQPSDKPVRGGKFDCGAGCLFDLSNDPTEHTDLAKIKPDLLASMVELLVEANKTLFAPERGNGDPQACVQARKYGGYYGPWLQL